MPIVRLPESCVGCGACCYGLYVEVTEEDHAVHGTPRDLCTTIPHPDDDTVSMPVMQQEGAHRKCVALDPETKLCTIYDQRPQVCRDFTRGDEPGGNDTCYEVVEGQRRTEGWMALPPRTRFQQALDALRAVTDADIDRAPVVERLTLLRQLSEIREGIILTVLAQQAGHIRELRRDVALLLHALPDAHTPTSHRAESAQYVEKMLKKPAKDDGA